VELRRATRPRDGVDRRLLATAEAPSGGRTTRSALNRLCRPDAWDDPAWLMFNRALGMPDGQDRFHRKAFEWTHCVFGLEQLGVLTPEARVLGVAAGHECVLYYLCNRVREVVATDLYAGGFSGGLAAEADPAFLTDPGRFAPFPYRREALVPMVADALALPFPDAAFDVVYSLSSIEHFGGHAASSRGMAQMARVLRPGGILCVATEWILEGGEDPELFTRAAFTKHVLKTQGLELTGPIDDAPPPRALIADPVWIDGDVERTPHLVVGRGRLRWTSVVVFLRRVAEPVS
ncbi:MAG: class I SAM-dependent methyltransferase, partial [Candidatus Dormiibacterota bacterium]